MIFAVASAAFFEKSQQDEFGGWLESLERIINTFNDSYESKSPSTMWMLDRPSSATLGSVAALLRTTPITVFDGLLESCRRNSN